jgi:hypothetical protein
MASGLQIKPTNAPNTSFHVTSHGISDLKPFPTSQHKFELLQRFRQHLTPKLTVDASRRPHTKLFAEVCVLAYCILDNHIHIVLHQYTADGMRRLIQRVLGSYGRFINRDLKRRGAVFDGRYAAVEIEELHGADQIRNAIAYTLLNDPILQLDNPHCSHGILSGERNCDWIDRDQVLAIFGGWTEYRQYMNRRGPEIVSRKLKERGINPELHPYRPI